MSVVSSSLNPELRGEETTAISPFQATVAR